jgi:branched-chain amino acid transport system substrate-binding protein
MVREKAFQIAFCFLMAWLFMGNIGMVEAAPPFKIGFIDGFTGPYANLAAETRAGIEIAIEEVNAKGGIAGRPIELVMRDDKLRPDAALRGAKDLVLSDKVDFLVGTTSSACALAVSGYAKESKVPFIVTISQSEHVTGKHGHRYIFRMNTNTHLYSYADAYAASRLPITKWWLLNPDYEYGHACYNQFKEMVKKLKPSVEFVGEGWPKLGEPDYTPFLTPFMASEATGLFSALAGADALKLIKNGKALGLFQKKTILDHDLGYLVGYFPLGKEMPEGIWGGTQYPFWEFKNNPRNNAFHQKIMSKLNNMPPSLSGAQGYETIWAIAKAAQKVGTADVEKIIDGLEGIRLDTFAGSVTIRKFDHQATWPFWYGHTKLTPDYPYPILVDMTKYQEEAYPTEEAIRKVRGE